MKKFLFFGLIILLSIPTFYLMLKPGIFSMQDFHFFRLFEFDKCVKDLQLPCRWSPDVGLGYGEPLFVFYGQLSYAFGEIFHLLGFSLVDSLKLLFIFSLIGSAVAMYFLAREMWGSKYSAFLSAAIYLYAPYRAVDVWVRGALPESLSFVFYPLIILFLEKYLKAKKKSDLMLFSLFLAFLILNHNLSFVLFMPFLTIWMIYRLVIYRKIKTVGAIFLAGLLSLGIVSFYVLPIVFESKYVSLDNTIKGYFNFRGHFAGIKQLLFSVNWGYGASLFGSDDDLNISIGFFQWLIPAATGIVLFFKRKLWEYKDFVVLILISIVIVFLINNRSIVVWDYIYQMSFIQFPWRFLGILVFALSLASGVFIKVLPRKLTIPSLVAIMVGLFVLNSSYFRPDIWHNYSDTDLSSGGLLEEQKHASVGDYWPIYSPAIPSKIAPESFGGQTLVDKKSNEIVYNVSDSYGKIAFPVNYFPGWQAYSNGKKLKTTPARDGLIEIEETEGEIVLKFEDTLYRKIGNYLSLFSILLFLALYTKFKTNEKYKKLN